ncbi:MAG: PASTA domain-containing protein [Alistipes sp.]|nr:PASTA domain-containing protein [Alistipes sp.]
MNRRTKNPSLIERLQQNRLLYNLLLIAGILLIMALAAHLIMQAGTRHGARRIVPDFSGIRLSDAEKLAARHDLELHINDSLFVPAYEGGIVLDQLPEGGVEVKPGRTVYITINSFRQKMVEVPYVAGRSLRQAKNRLEIAGLAIERLVYRPDMATNYVLAAFIGRDSITAEQRIEAEMGSGLILHVGVEESQNTTAVPQVVGLSLREAKGRIWESGLNVGKILFDEGINLLNQKEARVYLQTPAPETTTTLGAAVEVRLTLDLEVVAREKAAAEKLARERALEREEAERALADSLARVELEQAMQSAGSPLQENLQQTLERAVEQSNAAMSDDEFFN